MHMGKQRWFVPILGAALSAGTALGTLVVDNDDGAPAYVETGTWSTSRS